MSDPLLRAKVCIPVAITPSVLVSSNVPETDYPAWNSGTTYAEGEVNRVVVDRVVYQSIQAGNTNRPPATSPTWWKKVRMVNGWLMFDDVNNSQTTMPNIISFVLRPGQVATALAILNASGGRLRIRMIDPVAGMVYDKVTLMRGVLPASRWYDFFFAKRIRTADHVALDLPAYPNADIYVDLEVTSGDVSIGNVVLAQQIDAADGIRMGARVGFKDYSGNSVNEWGVMTLVQRDYANTASWQMHVPNNKVDSVLALFKSRRSKPTLFIGYSPIKATVIWGICTECDVLIPLPTYSVMSADFLGQT